MEDEKQNTYQSYLDFEQIYIPRGQNVLQQIFKDYFSDFKERYDEEYAKEYGNSRIDRISEVVEEFIKCGDYKEGLARIKCQNPECGYDYFVPLSCLSFYLCPSCHQKRTLLFGEQITNEVLLRLPHRQFVFILPKCLRVYFKHNRLLYSDISKLIFDLIQSSYNKISGKQIETGLILSCQTAADFARWNPHWHGLLIEGGFDDRAKESLAQYIVGCPISLEKIKYEPFHARVLFKTPKYNDYFKQNFKSFKALDTP